MRLIENWPQAWKFYSLHAAWIGLSLIGAWEGGAVPDSIKTHLPDWFGVAVYVFAGILILTGRVIKQGPTQ